MRHIRSGRSLEESPAVARLEAAGADMLNADNGSMILVLAHPPVYMPEAAICPKFPISNIL